MAAPQPPPTPTNILAAEEVPDDLALSILDRVPCKVDRVKVSLICKAWRDKMARLRGLAPRPPPLPWLLLPSSDPDGPSRVVCVLSDCRGHDYLTINPPGERFVGSYDGAWIFLYSDETGEHRLFNARTRQVRMLPEILVRYGDEHDENDDDPDFYSMVMLAATLSSSADKPKCVGATILALDVATDEVLQFQPFNRWIAFWRVGWDDSAYLMIPGVDVQAADLAMCLTEDVVFHERAFHFLLTRGGDYQILVCVANNPDPEDDAELEIESEVRSFRPPRQLISHQNATVRARYLVVSRGELLMVVRFATGANQQTSEFKVFRATRRPPQMPDDADFPVAQYPWAWSDLDDEDTLDGRILFVGYGCSRSYEANQYPGFKSGIYFLDDGMFYEALIYDFANTRPYPCRDNGMWSERRIQDRDCFPPPNSSDHSPPIWLLP